MHGFALAAVLAQKIPTGPSPGAVAAFGVGTVLGELLVLGALGASGALAALLTRGTRLARRARGPATARRT